MDLPNPGDLLNGKYRIVRLIGEGGMGSVYEARHEMLGTVVAIKFLDPELSENPALVGRFLQEARVSATLQSPFVTRVFDVEREAHGGAYLVMELLSGESLGDRLARVERLGLDEALGIALQVCAGLQTAHGQGIVHRDLKPENVFLVDGSASLVKILDFGIAKLKQSAEFVQVVTRPGSMMGTPAYMAPEQAIAADQVDARADIYSLGVILYEMLSGVRPVDEDEPSVIVERVMKGMVDSLGAHDPGLPPALVALVDRTLSANPDRRPASIEEVRRELAFHASTLSPAAQLAATGDPDAAALSSVNFDASRPSGIPKTVVNDSLGAPTTVDKTEPPDQPLPPVSMAPPTVQPPVHAVNMAPMQVHPPPAGRTSPGARWGILTVFVVVAGSAGIAAAYLAGVFESRSPPPPLPAAPSMATASDPLPIPRAAPWPGPRPSPRRSRAQRRPGSPSAPTAAEPGEEPRGVPLPTIQIPSVLPPIPGLPSTLPTMFPPFGAAPKPRAPAPSAESQAAPPSSAPAPSAAP